MAKLISAMVPTAPAPESLLRLPAGCHPAHAFSTCSLYIIHMAIEPLLAVSSYSPDLPRPIWNVSTSPFGPDGIFDPAQSDAISRLFPG